MNTDELLIPEEYRQEIRRIKAELEELEAKKETIRGCTFEEPSGRTSRRSGAYFEDIVIKQEGLQSELIRVTAEYIDAQNRICRKIENLEDERYKDILFYRCVYGCTIKGAMNECGYSAERGFYRLLKSAKEAYERMNEDDENKCEL